MGFISWIIVGALAGGIAGKLMGQERQGCLVNIVVGIIGGFLGGFLVELIGGTGVTGFNLWSLCVAVIGAVVFIGIVRLLRR